MMIASSWSFYMRRKNKLNKKNVRSLDGPRSPHRTQLPDTRVWIHILNITINTNSFFFRLFLWKSATKSVSPFTALAPIIGCISTTACHWAKVIKTWQINWIKINVLAVLTLPTQNLSMLAPAGTLMINLHEILKVMNGCFYTFAATRWSGMSGEADEKKVRRRLREERGFFCCFFVKSLLDSGN